MPIDPLTFGSSPSFGQLSSDFSAPRRPQSGPAGTLTWGLEGSDDQNSPYYSRTAHVPDLNSGLTIGRGYDLKLRSTIQVTQDLTSAGVPEQVAVQYAAAAGLKGNAAKEFVAENNLPAISAESEAALFAKEWQLAFADVQRISAKPDVVAKYGSVDWENLDSTIRDLVVDLRYRGDYTPNTRELIQSAIASNDLETLAETLSDPTLWMNVPAERRRARAEFAAQALAEN